MTGVQCPACNETSTGTRCPCGAWVIPLGPLDKILTANHGNRHWTYRSGLTKTWRDGAQTICKALKIPPMQHAVIHISWNPPDNRRRDSANCYPTAKAVVDGVVAAGVLPDDDWRHVDGPYMHMGPITKPASITIAILPVQDAA
jgi:hypothetical protein